MNYKRVTPGAGFQYISVLDTDTNELTTSAVWPDGSVTSKTKINILEVGWRSVAEFLQERKGFKPMQEV